MLKSIDPFDSDILFWNPEIDPQCYPPGIPISCVRKLTLYPVKLKRHAITWFHEKMNKLMVAVH